MFKVATVKYSCSAYVHLLLKRKKKLLEGDPRTPSSKPSSLATVPKTPTKKKLRRYRDVAQRNDEIAKELFPIPTVS